MSLGRAEARPLETNLIPQSYGRNPPLFCENAQGVLQNLDYCRDIPLVCQRYSLAINDIAKRCPYKINGLVDSATSSREGGAERTNRAAAYRCGAAGSLETPHGAQRSVGTASYTTIRVS